MVSVGIIIPYYGKLPVYFRLFLKGLENNRGILNVILFTDLPLIDYRLPDNLIVYNMSFKELKVLIEHKTSIPINMDSYYKLCDIKPSYGLVFEDYIKDYAFWGFGDLDVIYGDLEKLINQESLLKYDAIIGRKKWVSGCMAIFRNNDFMRKLFLKSKDVEVVFNNQDYLGFDEVSMCWTEVRKSEDPCKVNYPIQNFTFLLFNEVKNGIYLNNHDFYRESIVKNGFLHINLGKILDQDGEEYVLYHFITEKRKWIFKFPTWQYIPSEYYITPHGFFDKRIHISNRYRFYIKVVYSIIRYPSFLVNLFERLRNKLTNLIADVKIKG